MAISVSMSLTPSTASFGDPVRVSITIDNPDLNAVDVVSIRPNGPNFQLTTGMGVNGVMDGLSITVPGESEVTCHYVIHPYFFSNSQLVRVTVLTADGQAVVEDETLTVV